MTTFLEQEIHSQPEVIARLLERETDRVRADRRAAAGLRVCADRRARHIRSRRDLRQVCLGGAGRLAGGAGHALAAHALRRAAAHERRAGGRHLAVGPVARYRVGAGGGQAPGPADAGDHQRRRLAAGGCGRSCDRAARRDRAQRRRDQDLHRAAGGDGAAGGSLERPGPSGWPSCGACPRRWRPRWPAPAMWRGGPSATATWISAW